jgi:hypothetical protein
MSRSVPGGSNVQAGVEALLAEASRRTGLHDFGSPHFRAHLAYAVRDAQRPEVSDFGRRVVAHAFGVELAKRLKVVDALKNHPEIASVALPRIVLITGHARTGTTLLHNLLAQHRLAKPMLKWELMQPLPPPIAANRSEDPRIGKLQSSLDRIRTPELEQRHWVDAVDPEECVWGYTDCTGAFGRSCVVALPTWGARLWVGDHDARPTFREYRSMLQLLTWRSPAPVGGHLVLKAPQTAADLDQFLEVFPEASVVVLHRDPFRSLVSSAGLISQLNAPMMSDGLAWPDDGRQGCNYLANTRGVLTRLTALQPQLGRCTQTLYADLMADVAGTVNGIHDALDIAPDPEFETKVRSFLAAQRGGRRASPNAHTDTFGYIEDQVRSDPGVAAYVSAYGVPVEEQRISDVC